jgi:hypothetical protein
VVRLDRWRRRNSRRRGWWERFFFACAPPPPLACSALKPRIAVIAGCQWSMRRWIVASPLAGRQAHAPMHLLLLVVLLAATGVEVSRRHWAGPGDDRLTGDDRQTGRLQGMTGRQAGWLTSCSLSSIRGCGAISQPSCWHAVPRLRLYRGARCIALPRGILQQLSAARWQNTILLQIPGQGWAKTQML